MGISMLTFPIITRLFSVEEYGYFALVNTTISLALAFSKSGVSTAFAKNYPAYQDTKLSDLYSTSFWLQFLLAVVITCIYLIIILLLRKFLGGFLTKILLVTSPLVILRTMQALLLGFYRAEERVTSFNKISFIFRLGTSTAGIAGLSVINENVAGFFGGALIFESVMIFLLVRGRRLSLMLKDYSSTLGLALLKYGAPLVVYELSSLIIAYADRYQITHYLGAESLGYYSAGYNLCIYIDSVITGPLWMAIFPIYTKMWHREGKEKTRDFLSTCLKYYFALAIPIIFGGSLVGKDLVQLLAGVKYAAASQVIPFVLAGLLIYGAYHITAAGLYLNGKTNSVAIATAFCALLNVLLNAFFIPKFGIAGAAYTTLFANLLLLVIIIVNSFRYVRITIPVADLFMYVLFSGVMVLLISFPNITWMPGRIMFMLVAGFFIYSLEILIYDKSIRSLSKKFLNRMISKG